jgi:hypothetical protein
MNEIDLTMLGQLVTTLQSEMREVRTSQTTLVAETRTDLAALRAYVAAHLSGVQAALETYFDRRLATGLEPVTRDLRRIEARLDDIDKLLREALGK